MNGWYAIRSHVWSMSACCRSSASASRTGRFPTELLPAIAELGRARFHAAGLRLRRPQCRQLRADLP